ncbi:hypothetical protein niasHS_000067 [Heterodera schachtii]|uniref:C2H2-type domain-containing protein n=1 Tax=Heterodera schachtii TaxID=97005 RepID=A0ABD2KM24_HETSC
MLSESSSIVDISSPSPSNGTQTLGTAANGIGTSHGIGTPHSSTRHDTSSPLVASETFVDDAPDDSDSSSAVFYAHDNGTDGGKQKANKKQKDKFKCANCNTNFKSDEMLELHQNNCRRSVLSAPANFCSSLSFCDICNRKFTSPRGVALHKGKAHKRESSKLAKPKNLAKCPTATRAVKLGRPRKVGVVPPTSVDTAKNGRAHSIAAVPPIGHQNLLNGRHRTKPTNVATAQQQPNANVQIPKLRRHGHPVKMEVGSSLAHQSANKRRTNGAGGEQHRAPNGGDRQNGGGTQMDGDDGFGGEAEEDDDIVILEPETKHGIVPRNTFGTVGPQQQQQNCAASGMAVASSSSSLISHYAGMVISACAQSNMVTFHDVNTARGTIGQISFQFMCNACRGQRGVARCFRGRAYCIMCCGHPECD